MTALKAIRASRVELDDSDVAAAMSYLDPRQSINNIDPAIFRRVGAALLPPTGDPDQHVLESALFEAAHKAVGWGFLFPPASEMRRIHAIGAVTPGTDSTLAPLKIKLNGSYMLGPLLDYLLPTESDDSGSDDDSVSGLPGLRPYHRGSSLVLRLLDTRAQVEIVNVRSEDAGAADRFRRDANGEFTTVGSPTWLTHPMVMTDKEVHVLAYRRSFPARAEMYSQLIRRIGLFSESLRVDTWATKLGIFCEWAGRLHPDEVAFNLLDPIFGIAGFDTAQVYDPRVATLRRGRKFTDSSDSSFRLTLRCQDSLPLDGDTIQRWRDRPIPVAVQNWIASPAGQRAAADYDRGVIARRTRATGEPRTLISAGPPRAVADLDHSSPEQAHFRALLALHVFNHNRDGDPTFAPALLSEINCYSMTISPQWANLVIISNAPMNIVRRLLPDNGSPGGLPGLRLLKVDSRWIYHLIHLPTGARLTVMSTEDSSGPLPRPPAAHDDDTLAVSPLAHEETTRISLWPDLSPDERRLLAALCIRMSTRSPDGLWTLGTWTYDPARRLSRQQGCWELVWSEPPFLYDVAASLSDQYTHLRGAVLNEAVRSVTVNVGSASLILRGPDDPSAPVRADPTSQS